MREGVPQPADGVDEFSPTVAPISQPVSSTVTEAATGVPLRVDDAGDALLGAVLADRYSIERRVGAGGMGAVYVGTHLALAKKIAVKVIQPRLGADATIAQRFIQEARAASAIGHEHIVQITDFGATPEGGSFLVMEYLDGEDLAETLRREGPLPWPRVLHIAEQIAWALAAAHKNGIVHRDIKPANCYRVPREQDPDFIKVLDFGLAKVTEQGRRDGESLTHTGMLLGTPGYIAPELYRGLKADHRVDIYALGALMHKLLTGELPPMCGSDEGEPMRGLPAPDAVSTVLGKALRENPDQRWTSAHELAQALRAVPRPSTSDEPTLLQPLTGAAPIDRRDRRSEPPSVLALSAREPTPVSSFSSLVSVERDGSRVRLSLGVPAILMLLALIGGLVYSLTRRDPAPAPVAQDMSPRPALPVAAPPQPPPPLPLPPLPPPQPLRPSVPTTPPPTPVADPPPAPIPVADPPVNQPPVEPPAPASVKLTPGSPSRLADHLTRRCMKDSEMFFKVKIEWRTDANGTLVPHTASLAKDQPTLPGALSGCVRTKLKQTKFSWKPNDVYKLELPLGKPPAG